MNEIRLEKTWTLGARIGDQSGFGQVFEAIADDGAVGAVKVVPKEPGAERELLFEDISGVENVVPIIDSGEVEDYWVLVMPRAECSLRAHLAAMAEALAAHEAAPILEDVAQTLAELDGRVVHRDQKPENILLLNGRWCLADFGIARHADASTQPDTRKFAMSPAYAAPERWRHERATGATDVYSFGVVAWETLMGRPPFPGPTWEEFREQHLHTEPPAVAGAPPALASLIQECLYKAQEARPSPKALLDRLQKLPTSGGSGGDRLRAAYQEIVERQASADAAASAADSEEQRCEALFTVAARSLQLVSARMRQAVIDNAPAAKPNPRSRADDWSLCLGSATIGMDPARRCSAESFGRWPPAFDVVAVAAIGIDVPPGRDEYYGRSHSLWYGDLQEKGAYRWFEPAFTVSALIPKRLKQVPAAMEPNENSGKAFSSGMTERSLARPVVPIDQGEEDAFIDRWLVWFGEAVAGQLRQPRALPEGEPQGSYRVT